MKSCPDKKQALPVLKGTGEAARAAGSYRWVGEDGGRLKRNYSPPGLQMVDSIEKRILDGFHTVPTGRGLFFELGPRTALRLSWAIIAFPSGRKSSPTMFHPSWVGNDGGRLLQGMLCRGSLTIQCSCQRQHRDVILLPKRLRRGRDLMRGLRTDFPRALKSE